jgi:hypothetical protein
VGTLVFVCVTSVFYKLFADYLSRIHFHSKCCSQLIIIQHCVNNLRKLGISCFLVDRVFIGLNMGHSLPTCITSKFTQMNKHTHTHMITVAATIYRRRRFIPICPLNPLFTRRGSIRLMRRYMLRSMYTPTKHTLNKHSKNWV